MTSDLSGFRSIGFDGFDFLDFAKRFDVVFSGDYEAFVGAQSGSGRNQAAADDVLLHSLEIVDLAGDGCFVEHFRGLLE